MIMKHEDYLMQLAIESGEVAPEEEVEVSDVLSEELDHHHHHKAGIDMVEHAELASDIAEQLDEVADKAEELASQDQEYARNEVSVESLHRQFQCIMTANDLSFKATSYSCESSNEGRLEGLTKDARRTAKIIRNYREENLDYSQEGAIMQFLRRDASRLQRANLALKTVLTRMDKKDLDENDSKVIHH